jgi:WD40 repeat protein
MSEQGRVLRWNPLDGTKLLMPERHSDQGFSVAVTSDGKYAASNGLDQKLRVWSVETNQCTATFELALGARYLTAHPSQPWIVGPMPSNIAEVANDNVSAEVARGANLALWNLKTGKVDQCYSGLTNWAMKLRFSNDGTMFAAATISDGAVVWNTLSADATHFFFDGQPQVDDVVFSKDGKFLLVAYHDGHVGIWNTETKKLERKMVCHGDQIVGLLLSADGQRLITASPQDPILRIWDWINGQKVGELDSGLEDVSELIFDTQIQNLLIGSSQGNVHLFRFEN